MPPVERTGAARGDGDLIHHACPNALTVTPAASSAERTSAARRSAPGVSLWMHIVSASIGSTEPSRLTTARSVDHPHRAGDDGVRIVNHGAGLLTRCELAVRFVGAVGKHLERDRQAERSGGIDHRGVRRGEQHQRSVEGGHGARQRSREVGDLWRPC